MGKYAGRQKQRQIPHWLWVIATIARASMEKVWRKRNCKPGSTLRQEPSLARAFIPALQAHQKPGLLPIVYPRRYDRPGFGNLFANLARVGKGKTGVGMHGAKFHGAKLGLDTARHGKFWQRCRQAAKPAALASSRAEIVKRLLHPCAPAQPRLAARQSRAIWHFQRRSKMAAIP